MSVVAPSKRDRTRSGLLVALQELLLDPAVGTVSVPQVTGRAGVSQGTFYNYFDSLADALDEVGGLVLVEHARVLAQVSQGASDLAEVVARSARQTLTLFAGRPEAGRVLFDSGLPVDSLLAGVRAHLDHDVALGLEAGVFRVADPQVTVTVVTGALLGACLDLHRGRLTADAVPAVVWHLLRLLGVGERRAERLVGAPQEFVSWSPFPFSPVGGRS